MTVACIAAATLAGRSAADDQPAPPCAEDRAVRGPTRLAVLELAPGPGVDPALAQGLALEFAERMAYLPDVIVRFPEEAGEADAYGGRDPESLGADVLMSGTVAETDAGIRVDVRLDRGGALHPAELGVSASSAVDLPLLMVREVAAALALEAPPGRVRLIGRARGKDDHGFRPFLRALGGGPAARDGAGDPVEVAKEVVALDPTFAPAHALLARRYLARGASDMTTRDADYTAADHALRHALNLDPDLPMALDVAAALFSRTGRQEEATTLLRRAIDVHPNRPELHFRMGYVLRYAGLLTASVAAYRRGLCLDDRPASVVSGEGQIAKALVYLGDYDGALALQKGLYAHLERAGQPVDEKMLFYEGVMHFYAGATDSALARFDAAWAADSTSVWSAFGRAYGYAAVGDTARLVALARELQARDVADGERHYRLVHFYSLAGKHQEATRRARSALDGGFFSYPYVRSDPLTASARETGELQPVLADMRTRHESFRR